VDGTSFYNDSHISYVTLNELEMLGHTVIRTQAVGMVNAPDHQHLWYAAQYDHILLTHDRGFKLWHQAWLF
jgi:hypothetical protein